MKTTEKKTSIPDLPYVGFEPKFPRSFFSILRSYPALHYRRLRFFMMKLKIYLIELYRKKNSNVYELLEISYTYSLIKRICKDK